VGMGAVELVVGVVELEVVVFWPTTPFRRREQVVVVSRKKDKAMTVHKPVAASPDDEEKTQFETQM